MQSYKTWSGNPKNISSRSSFKKLVEENMRDQPKSFKAIFDNFFEEPTREKLRELLRENLGEFAYCDFKATWIEPSKLSRHIIAMANSGRGCLIFGVAENTDGTNDPIGLSALTDKKEIFEKIEKYIPSQLRIPIYPLLESTL